MFRKEEKNLAETQSTTSNIISRGTILEGNIKTPGNLILQNFYIAALCPVLADLLINHICLVLNQVQNTHLRLLKSKKLLL